MNSPAQALSHLPSLDPPPPPASLFDLPPPPPILPSPRTTTCRRWESLPVPVQQQYRTTAIESKEPEDLQESREANRLNVHSLFLRRIH